MLVTPSIRFRLRLASPGSRKAREVSAASFMRVTAGAVRKAREVTALFQEGWMPAQSSLAGRCSNLVVTIQVTIPYLNYASGPRAPADSTRPGCYAIKIVGQLLHLSEGLALPPAVEIRHPNNRYLYEETQPSLSRAGSLRRSLG